MAPSNVPDNVKHAAIVTGRHEFGHCIVAIALGFEIVDVSLTAKVGTTAAGHSQILLDRAFGSMAEVVTYEENRARILYAGCISQSLVNGKPQRPLYESLLKTNGVNDNAKIGEATRVIRGCTVASPQDDRDTIDQQFAKIFYDLTEETAQIVERHADLINALANHLAAKIQNYDEPVTLTKAEIEAFPDFKKHFP